MPNFSFDDTLVPCKAALRVNDPALWADLARNDADWSVRMEAARRGSDNAFGDAQRGLRRAVARHDQRAAIGDQGRDPRQVIQHRAVAAIRVGRAEAVRKSDLDVMWYGRRPEEPC